MPPGGKPPGGAGEVGGEGETGDEEEGAARTAARRRRLRRGYAPPRIFRSRAGRVAALATTSSAIFLRLFRRRSRSPSSCRARMATARWPAFLAPIEPTPTAATGTPGGIWTVAR